MPVQWTCLGLDRHSIKLAIPKTEVLKRPGRRRRYLIAAFSMSSGDRPVACHICSFENPIDFIFLATSVNPSHGTNKKGLSGIISWTALLLTDIFHFVVFIGMKITGNQYRHNVL
jgi:hypothetical protein